MCTESATAYASTATEMTPIANSADEVEATSRSSRAPPQPIASPTAAPPTSSSTATTPTCHHGSGVCPGVMPAARAVTRSTTGASLKPDSASSTPVICRGSGTRRSTENTAAASVEASTAATRKAICQSHESSRCAATPTTSTDTPTPTVASSAAGATDRRMPDHRVVMPPSMRMRTRAA